MVAMVTMSRYAPKLTKFKKYIMRVNMEMWRHNNFFNLGMILQRFLNNL